MATRRESRFPRCARSGARRGCPLLYCRHGRPHPAHVRRRPGRARSAKLNLRQGEADLTRSSRTSCFPSPPPLPDRDDAAARRGRQDRLRNSPMRRSKTKRSGFKAGTSTTFFVLQQQEILSSAQNSYAATRRSASRPGELRSRAWRHTRAPRPQLNERGLRRVAVISRPTAVGSAGWFQPIFPVAITCLSSRF